MPFDVSDGHDRRPHDIAGYASHDEEAPASTRRSRTVRSARRVPSQPPPEIAFLETAGLDPACLRQAVQEARTLNVTPDAALLAARRIGEDDFYRALARHLGIPFISQHAPIAPGTDHASATRAGIAPLLRWPGGPRWIFAPRGRQIAALPRMIGRKDVVLTSPRRLGALLRAAAQDRIAQEAAATLDPVAPDQTARLLRPRRLWLLLTVLLALFGLGAWIDSGLFLGTAEAVLWLAFAGACVLRLAALAHSFAPQEAAPALTDAALPLYTVVIALYREANVADALVRALERIDYPRAKLDIKFVIEEDDRETYDVLATNLPGVEYDIIVAPAGAPRTKPRALNVALPFARGEHLVVFDAEDRPDPGQLRRAAARFATAGPDLVALQARLAIDNTGDGPMQALYALDYAALFEVTNPGLAAMGLPLFLGGSSNHFRTDRLIESGGWDAWNVTEDADLGLRLARRGLTVETLASTTGEEAPPNLHVFFRQRMRWMKGWLQTLGVHMGRPRALLCDLGAKRTAAVFALFVSGVLGPMVWPFYTAWILYQAVWGELLAPKTAWDIAHSTAIGLLTLAGLLSMVAPIVIGAARQKLMRYLWLVLALPLWHVVLCAAAWWALRDLVRDPFGWMKTPHGQARRRAPLHNGEAADSNGA